jgi:DNA-directed RNA polymerase specialized sigma24 family protein
MDRITKLYNIYHKTLIKYLKNSGETQQNSEDIVQDVFLKLWKDPSLYKSTRTNHPLNFLCQCVKNRKIDYTRFGFNKHKSYCIDDIDEKYLPIVHEDEPIELGELYDIVIQCLPRCLNLIEQCLINFICLESHSYLEAAMKYKMSEDDVTYKYRLAKVRVQRYVMIHYPKIAIANVKLVLNGNKASWIKCKKLVQTMEHEKT